VARADHTGAGGCGGWLARTLSGSQTAAVPDDLAQRRPPEPGDAPLHVGRRGPRHVHRGRLTHLRRHGLSHVRVRELVIGLVLLRGGFGADDTAVGMR
jgi:hypothetical protein